MVIEIDHKFTYLTNISGGTTIMVMAVKRTGTNYLETQLVTTRFCKSLKPRQSLQCNNDYQITDTEEVAKAGGMDYAVFAWPCFLRVADPRDEWLPEVFTIRYDPSTSRYGLFPTVTCAKLTEP